jgi:hypothetical protein
MPDPRAFRGFRFPAEVSLTCRSGHLLSPVTAVSSPPTAHHEKDPTMMLDWVTYRQQVIAGVGEIGRLSPDAVAVTVRCDGCSPIL